MRKKFLKNGRIAVKQMKYVNFLFHQTNNSLRFGKLIMRRILLIRFLSDKNIDASLMFDKKTILFHPKPKVGTFSLFLLSYIVFIILFLICSCWILNTQSLKRILAKHPHAFQYTLTNI